MPSSETQKDLAGLRRHYALQTLRESDVSADPFEQFEKWFLQAVDSKLLEPNAMTLATASKTGIPSARIVLLKGFDKQGFVFFTNYESQKGRELDENPHACLLFSWLELERQVRISGHVNRVATGESEQYFQGRPKGSQIGAWASPQSQVIASRRQLEDCVVALEKEYSEADALPLPPFWGGYRVTPTELEFWQGRENRLHDRLRYRRQEKGWIIDRLAP